MATDELPEPTWAKHAASSFTGNQAILAATLAMHNALVQELRLLVNEQRRTNQLLEWLGNRLATPSS